MRALWTIVFIVTIGGSVANTSRMAQVVALVMLVAIGVDFRPGSVAEKNCQVRRRSVALAGAFAIVWPSIALAQADSFGTIT